ncbi:Protein of unknown function [Lactobacillus helveticus CIRM-BIA 953]|uniref:Alcohol dehydrogenase n=1 Tax=Lactobacillus helveticus CIRM-BIA 953 TaxID=1226335 RepID=U4QH24_LACHE|nr:Protein of unknown function [Lactobacillus helveticus CIRM-BIA 953]
MIAYQYDKLLTGFLGYHAARVANVQPGDSVIVLGDGAVGLSAILQLNCAELNKLFQLVVTQIVKL